MLINKKSKFLSADSVFFFSACIILFLINQLYSVLQVSLIMKSTGSILLLSSVMTAMVIPRIFILPVSGLFTDKLGIFKTLIIGTGLLGLLLISLFLVNQDSLVNENIIFIFAVLFGGISAAILPALYSAIPVLMGGEHLQKANSVMQFINQGATLIGPLLAGFLVEKTSDKAYPIMAVSAVTAFFLFCGVGCRENRQEKDKAHESGASQQGALLFTAILNLCIIGPQQVGFPVIAMNCLSEGVDGYTRLLSVTGLGALISAVFIGNMKRRDSTQSIHLILWCALILGMIWSIFSYSSSRLVIMVSIFTAGLLLGIINVLFLTTIQQLTPAFLVGRVMSIQFLCSTGLQPVSYMITGVLLDKFNINNLYLISGGIISLLSILILVYSKKNRKWMRRVPSA